MRLIMMPRSICATPMMILIFIFIELVNGSSPLVPCHAGSSPKAYVLPFHVGTLPSA